MRKRPILVIRAQVHPAIFKEFEVWHIGVHIPLLLQIPGLRRGFRCRPASGRPNCMALYEFEDEESIRSALSSEAADRARRGWECWLPHMTDFSVEVYASLTPIRTFPIRN